VIHQTKHGTVKLDGVLLIRMEMEDGDKSRDKDKEVGDSLNTKQKVHGINLNNLSKVDGVSLNNLNSRNKVDGVNLNNLNKEDGGKVVDKEVDGISQLKVEINKEDLDGDALVLPINN